MNEPQSYHLCCQDAKQILRLVATYRGCTNISAKPQKILQAISQIHPLRRDAEMRWTMSSDKLFHSANQQKPSLRTRWNKVQKLRQVLQCSWQCLSASAQNQYLKNNKQNRNELMEVDGHIILHPYNFSSKHPCRFAINWERGICNLSLERCPVWILWVWHWGAQLGQPPYPMGPIPRIFSTCLRVIKLSQPAGCENL